MGSRRRRWFDSQYKLCADIINHKDDLKEWITWLTVSDEAVQNGLRNIVDAYNSGMEHDAVSGAYYKAIYHHLAVGTINESSVLNGFSGVLFNEQISQFKKIDAEITELAKKAIYCILAGNVPDFGREAAKSSEVGILQRAIKSNGRGLSIRSLLDQIPTLLPRLCPCMLMSPLSVAQYLDPNRTPFDLVIFDEASQLPTSKAVGALARGEEAIIVGDPKQMPPTSFFASNMFDEENADTEDLESILDDCLVLNMPETHLLWHYRSRHESLIAFSNNQFYENKLYTFPSVNDRESKVTLVKVNGIFERGKKRFNKKEAELIVEEVKRRAKDDELRKYSVGIVTFNINQQNLIDDMLNDACAEDPELESWIYNETEPVFIKNLENVQGDERDAILFSISYGPDEDGKISMNFGPLNREGGWRRLNVAVSRARYEMKVFSSLSADQINLSRTKAEGVVALKEFLEYAAGKTTLLDEINGIWMCRTHAALIDRDEKYFTVEMLKSWKEDAEKNAADEIIGQVDEVRKCKFRMNLFYMDFLEDKKILALLNKSRGAMVDESCFPVQNEWEKHLEEISYLIGAELSTSMYRILRELQVFKEIMKKEIDRCAGRRMSDKESLAYCRRADLFKERMEEWLTDEFIESIKFFCDFSKE